MSYRATKSFLFCLDAARQNAREPCAEHDVRRPQHPREQREGDAERVERARPVEPGPRGDQCDPASRERHPQQVERAWLISYFLPCFAAFFSSVE